MPRGDIKDSGIGSPHLPECPKAPTKRPNRRRKASKKPVGKSELVDGVQDGTGETGTLGLDNDGPISPRVEMCKGFPSSGESPATEKGNLLESDDRASEIENDIGGEEPSTGVVDVMRVLEELQLAVDEPELSADQLRINDQLQEDELLAMESIYGENVIILDRERGLRAFEVRIEPKIPDEFTITTKLHSSGEMKMDSSSTTDEFSYSFRVKFLPPIVLTCLFPKSYPSHKPPHFTISVQWLDCPRIASLCSVLDSLWMEQQGQEVMYQWIDWLQSFSLPQLGIHQEIILGPYGIKHIGDRRAVSGSVSPDVDIPSLRRYNDKQVLENFLNDFHQCSICFSEHAEGTLNKLLCPESKCGGIIPQGLLKELLGDEKYEHYESLMLQKTLDCMSDVVYCPRCELVCIEDEDHCAQCSNCFFSFCSLCKNKRHIGEACLTPELRLQILQERLKSSRSVAQMRVEQNKINEFLSESYIARDSKQCPVCRMAISRTGGCNKMVCGNCGNYFCYRCNLSIDGYDHFSGGECELFPAESIRQWEQQMNNRQAGGVVRVENIGHPHKCASCNHQNWKIENNNHIFCWKCKKHYCYLCRNVVKRSSDHYGGPNRCKQHTAG
ncbi:unnamed protein product [Linum tenue]|uniref:RBR-type E3 ubiquitin transferase n=1 Tax=Linum tenue TaxID=586396 RepID=A0AAV0PJC3_9ROSI|nr:unnamed protein product [Linum tenue]